MAIPLSLCIHHPPNPHQNPTSPVPPPTTLCFPAPTSLNSKSKRHFILKTASLCLISFIPKCPVVQSSENSPTSKPGLPAIANTKSWFQFYGDGFSIRVPPQFEDLTEPEAKDITDIGSLREAAKIFVPGGSTLFSARTFKIKEDEGFRTYYFYEFGKNEQHVALVATVNSGQVFVAGATAPLSKWDEDGIKLRSAAISLTVL
ncbi:uncharacterized protein LOC101214471 isoform X2 [Cucumis sativus]|uniref:uncharacterized protein LOC101214471 isoform X2 n=1 Tax=Cucumis sativus TaxID=3659 RepID=UPI0012F4F86F|nr:uncharacterized protein LOC101214471 isoform X2 [Cucumis sativus]